MDIDIGFWLTVLVVITGAIWLLDRKFGWADAVREAEQRAEQRKAAAKQGDGAAVDAAALEAGAVAEEKPGKLAEFVAFSNSLVPVFLVVLVVRSFLFEPFTIPSGSMLPTLQVHDFVLVNKFSYGLRLPATHTLVADTGTPERGEVMVFRFPEDPSKNYIKRVIGLPGDTVAIRGDRLYINDNLVEQTLVDEDVYLRDCQAQRGPFVVRGRAIKVWTFVEELDGKRYTTQRVSCATSPELATVAPDDREWQVPDDSYFVMGDNRDNSQDSRFWGFVPSANIVGRASVIWMHWEGLTSLPGFSRNGAIDKVEQEQ